MNYFGIFFVTLGLVFVLLGFLSNNKYYRGYIPNLLGLLIETIGLIIIGVSTDSGTLKVVQYVSASLTGGMALIMIFGYKKRGKVKDYDD